MRFQLLDIKNTFVGFSRLCDLASASKGLEFDNLEVDFGQVSWFDANMCAPLGALLYQIHSALNEVTLTNMKPSVNTILCKNGFLSAYGEEKAQDTYGTTIVYTRFEPKDERFFASYLEHHFTGKDMPRMSQGLDKRFRESIFEIFNNAVLHSKTRLGIYACGQFFPNKKPLDFSIADLGIGIQQNIHNQLGLDFSPEDAIRWATMDKNTTKTGSVPGGLGLKLLKEFVSINGGRIQIVSERGYWEFAGGNISTKQFSSGFPGTVVNLEINTADENSYCLASEISSDDLF